LATGLAAKVKVAKVKVAKGLVLALELELASWYPLHLQPAA
jgi:hypothetical protein